MFGVFVNILLFGGSGQLGYEIRPRGKALHFDIAAPVASEIDIVDKNQVIQLVKDLSPEVIINAAAYTAVDLAESEPDLAFKVNSEGVRNIAIAAKEIQARLIHVSTDYVFDGSISRPLNESDPVSPPNQYGASKLAGEKAVLEVYPENSLIVRTSSLHGSKGVNFVHTMLKLFKEKEEVAVVNDQIMSPTYAGWLAEVLLDLSRYEITGVLHASCQGAISWFEFASEIMTIAKKNDVPIKARLKPISAAEFYRPAKRPSYSVFDCTRLTEVLGRAPIDWKDGLRQHMRELGIGK